MRKASVVVEFDPWYGRAVTKRSYGQYCALARAAELVGERWSLLIVRDLLVAPRRFSDLRRGLPKIPTNILTARLDELESAGIVRRRALPRPERATVYELTAYGLELEEAVVALARWGAKSLGAPRPDEIVTVDSLVTSLRTTYRPKAARGLSASFELRVGPMVVGVRIARGTIAVAEGALPKPDLVIRSGPEITALMTGEVKPEDAVRRGLLTIEGNARLLARFAEIFHIDPMPSAIPA